MRYMLDTNICIFMIKHIPNVKSAFEKNKEFGIAISTIVLSELEYGIARSQFPVKNKNTLINFLSNVTVLDFDSRAAVEYGNICADLYRKGTPVGPKDMLIGAHAKSAGLTLVTNNIREFSRINGLTIEDWSE